MRKKRAYSKAAAALLACACCVALVIGVAVGTRGETNGQQSLAQPAAAASGAEGPANSTAAQDASDAGAPEKAVTRPHEPGVVLAQLAEGAQPADAAAAIEGATVRDAFGDYVVLALPDDITVEDAISELSESSMVALVQPNYFYTVQGDASEASAAAAESESGTAGESPLNPLGASATSADSPALLVSTSLQAQDSIDPDDPMLADQWALESMHVPEAWKTVRANGLLPNTKKVTVAVLDEGFEVDHPDLAGNIVGVYNAPMDSTERSDVGETPSDAPHGTHVAGIVSADANNGQGVAGVSYDAGLLLVKVYRYSNRIPDEHGGVKSGYTASTEEMVKAYDYVMDHADEYNIRVINASLGATVGPPNTWDDEDLLLLQSIAKAHKAGIVTVFSSGNTGDANYNYPSDYAKCISVINLMTDDKGVVRRADGSTAQKKGTSGKKTSWPTGSYNPEGQMLKDIAAPGSSILSTWTKSEYGYNNGSSMASPGVSGVMSLIFAAKPDLTVDEASSLLFSTATDLQYVDGNETAGAGFDRYTGYGEPNAAAAIDPDAVYLSGATATVVGESIKLAVGPSAQAGAGTWTWSSSDPKVATVTQAGSSGAATVVGKSTGMVTISATNGTRTAVQTVAVYEPQISGNTKWRAVGDTVRLSIDKVLANDWKWTSSDKSVVTVNASTGRAKMCGLGTATLVARLASDPTVEAKISVSVTSVGIGQATITGITSRTYTGKAVKQPKLRLEYAGKKLKEGVDYTVSYKNNTRVGTATVTIQGKGLFSGKVTRKFAIVPKPKWSGATELPVGGRAKYTVASGSISVLPGGTGKVKVSGSTLVGKKAGTVRIALSNIAGQRCATRTITVYDLGGTWKIMPTSASSMRLAVAGASKKAGASVVAMGKAGKGAYGTAQKFRLTAFKNGTYVIRNVRSGKAIDVADASKKAGANVIQNTVDVSSASQRWVLKVDSKNRVYFVNARSKKALGFTSVTSTGANVVQKAKAAKFAFVKS